MDVEALAVSEINRLLALCPHLKAFIAMNDKTPFTDGHIDIYNGLRQSNDEWHGRVPVQVKGRTNRASKKKVRNRKRKGPTYAISRSALLAYQKDSGVLYFYVDVDLKGGCTPYFALLSPFAIESILREMPEGQAQVSVQFKNLSTDVDEIERLVRVALKTRDQNVSIGFDPALMNMAQSFTVHSASDLNFDEPVVLTPGVTDFALVLNTAGGLSVPIDGELRIVPPDYMERQVDVQTIGGAIAYDSALVKRVDPNALEAQLSEGLKITFKTGGGPLSAEVALKLERTLAGRLKGLEFFVSLRDTQSLSLGGQSAPIEINQDDDISSLRSHLNYLRWLNELLEHLGVDTRLIEPDLIDETQVRQLRVIHRAFVRDEEIEDATAKTARVLQGVGQWQLMFLMVPGDAPGKARLVDPFAVDQRQQFRWTAQDAEEEGEAIPVTAYDVVEEEYLPTIVNMRLDNIVGAYEAISDFDTTFGVANQRLLALISAADAEETRRDALLDAAARLNTWLLDEENEQTHHRINSWQIVARRSGLSPEQRKEIRDLKRQVVRAGAENAVQVGVACAILLGDSEDVEDLLPQLSDEELELMKTWPIWRLRRDDPQPDEINAESTPA